MTLWRTFTAWALGWFAMLWRATCRIRIENDPRPALRAAGKPYVMALLHAHQIAAIMCHDEHDLAAMVSRSGDGDLLVPFLRLRRVTPMRGSTARQGRSKGGTTALLTMTEWVAQRKSAVIAVDGPKGPRNHVHGGVVTLARHVDAAIIPVIALASRRWFLQRTWDRMQLPRPFSQLRLIFGTPIAEAPQQDEAALRHRVETELRALEQSYDPAEAADAAR